MLRSCSVSKSANGLVKYDSVDPILQIISKFFCEILQILLIGTEATITRQYSEYCTGIKTLSLVLIVSRPALIQNGSCSWSMNWKGAYFWFRLGPFCDSTSVRTTDFCPGHFAHPHSQLSLGGRDRNRQVAREPGWGLQKMCSREQPPSYNLIVRNNCPDCKN